MELRKKRFLIAHNNLPVFRYLYRQSEKLTQEMYKPLCDCVRTISLLLIGSLVTQTALCQHKAGVKINLGASTNTGLSYFPTTLDDNSIRAGIGPSGNAGVYYHYQFGKYSKVGAELLFSQIESHEIHTFSLRDEFGVVDGSAEINTYSHMSYLSLPIYYGVVIDQWTIHIGYRGSWLVSEGYTTKIESSRDITGIQNKSYGKDLNIIDYDHGILLGATYDWKERWSAELVLYQGIANLTKKRTPHPLSSHSTVANNMQWVLGIGYQLFNTSSKPKQ